MSNVKLTSVRNKKKEAVNYLRKMIDADRDRNPNENIRVRNCFRLILDRYEEIQNIPMWASNEYKLVVEEQFYQNAIVPMLEMFRNHPGFDNSWVR